MTLTPDGKELVVANMDSDTLQFFSVEGNGRPRFTGKTVKTESPCALVFRQGGRKMNLGIVSLLLLAVAIAIGFFRKTNVGLVCMLFAVVMG